MSNTSTATTDTNVDTTVTATAPVAKKRAGRHVDPNSKSTRSKELLAALPADQLTRAIAVPYLEKELDIKSSVANVYFYTHRPKPASTKV